MLFWTNSEKKIWNPRKTGRIFIETFKEILVSVPVHVPEKKYRKSQWGVFPRNTFE